MSSYLDLGGHDLGGGLGGGRNSSPLLSFLVEKVRGSSWGSRWENGRRKRESTSSDKITWKSGLGKQEWEVGVGGGLQGVDVTRPGRRKGRMRGARGVLDILRARLSFS